MELNSYLEIICVFEDKMKSKKETIDHLKFLSLNPNKKPDEI